MGYSLSEAAKATGKNKSTIQRAIKNGKVSGSKDASGAYAIEPAELHRVFAPVVAQSGAQHGQSNDAQQGGNASGNNRLERVLQVETELAVARERNAGLEEQKRYLTETVEDLRKRLDSSESWMVALLEDRRPGGFLRKLFGR